MAVVDLPSSRPKVVRANGKLHRFPPEATTEQISAALSKLYGPSQPASPAPMAGVVGGSSTAQVAPRRAIAEARSQPINPYSRMEQPSAPQAANPIVRGFTGTIYGGNVAGAGGTIEAAGAATGIRPVESAGRALRQHGERFTAPPPPDIFQIAPDDPAGRQKVLDYLGYVTGAGIASSAPSVVGGVVGGIAGAPGGPAGVTAGAVAGAAIPAYLMNTGGVYQEIEKIGGGSPAGRARIALVIGLPVTALDVFSAVKFSGKLTRFLLHQAAARPLAARVAVGGLKGAVTEGGTEGAQRVVQDVGIAAGTKKEFDVGETARGALGDAIGGGLTGGVLGGATSIPQRTDGGGGGTPDARSQARAARRAAAKAPAEEAQTLAVRPPPLPAEDAVLPRVQESAPAAKAAPAPAAGAPTEVQARIAALETQIRKRPNEPKLRRRLEALKAQQAALVGPEDEAHAALQARIAAAPKRIAALEKQIAETPNDKRVGKWKARVEELRSLVAAGKPKAKGAAGEQRPEPAPVGQTTAPESAPDKEAVRGPRGSWFSASGASDGDRAAAIEAKFKSAYPRDDIQFALSRGPRAMMVVARKGDDYPVHWIYVPEDERGRGLGRSMYLAADREAQKRGGRLVSSDDVSDAAKGLWESLVKRGLAQRAGDGYRMGTSKAGRAAPGVRDAGVEGSAAARPQTTPKSAAAPEAPARMMVPGFQFGDEATAQRVADGIRTPGADPKVVRTKKGWEIEVNEGAGASRLKKQSFVKVAPKNPAPDVVAAAEPDKDFAAIRAARVEKKAAVERDRIARERKQREPELRAALQSASFRRMEAARDFKDNPTPENRARAQSAADAANAAHEALHGAPPENPWTVEAASPVVEKPAQPEANKAATVYHETSVGRATALLPFSNVFTDLRDDHWLSDNPDLATGQGKNKGVFIEFDRSGLRTQAARSKPGAALADGSEYVGRYNAQADYQRSVRAVTVSRDAVTNRVDAKILKDQLARLEKAGWTKSETPHGTRYAAPGNDAPAPDRLAPAAKPVEAKPPPAVSGVSVGQRVVHQASLAVGEVVRVDGENVVIKTDTGGELGGNAKMFRALPAGPAPAARRNLPKVPAKSEDLARQGKPLKEATAQAKARSGSDPPAGPGLDVPRGTRNYQPGEQLTVPYSGRSKTMTSERGVVKGYVDVGGVPHVQVEVRRGGKVEIHQFAESQVRRRPKIDRRPASGRNPGMATKLRDEAGGDVEKARKMVEQAQTAFDITEKAAQAAYEAKKPEYRGLRERMRKAHDALEVAKGIVAELEPPPNFEVAIDEAMKAWMANPERGAINIADMRAALVAAAKRLSGIMRRDPAIKAAAKVKYEPPPVVARMLEALKQAIPAREDQEALNATERAHRAALATVRRKGKYGLEELYALKSAYKGEFAKIDFESIAQAFSKANIDELVALIMRHPALALEEQMRAGDALEKMFGGAGGQIPERNEILLLEMVFGPEFVEAMSKLRPQLLSWRAAGIGFIDISRALSTAIDLSAALRQGWPLAVPFPKEYAKAWVNMHRFWASKEAFRESIRRMQQDPLFKYARQAHLPLKDRHNSLAITRVSSRGDEALLGEGEEAFFGANLAENLHELLPEAAERIEKHFAGDDVGKVKRAAGQVAAASTAVLGQHVRLPLRVVSSGVRRSEQGYVGFLNELRFDVFKVMFRAALRTRRARVSEAIRQGKRGATLRRIMDEHDPRVNAKLLQEISSFINSATGRGDSEFVSQHASLLSRIFWSPRFIVSHGHMMMAPLTYLRKSEFARRQMWKVIIANVGLAAMMLSLAKWMGAQVETNRKSPDFLKIRVGGVVYDILGGYVQYFRFAPELVETLWNQQTTGKNKAVNAYMLSERFVGNKLVSTLQFVHGFLHGRATERDDTGKRGPFKWDHETLKLFIPMAAGDVMEVLKADPRQLPVTVPFSTYGGGVQAYPLSSIRDDAQGRRIPRMPSAPRAPQAPSAP